MKNKKYVKKFKVTFFSKNLKFLKNIFLTRALQSNSILRKKNLEKSQKSFLSTKSENLKIIFIAEKNAVFLV